MLGDDLISYVGRRDVQQAMHPEIHAELEFGYDQSMQSTAAEMLDQIRIFGAHQQEWREVDADIVAARDQYARIDTPGAAELQKAASFEVAACDAMWQGEWPRALELIRQILDALRGGRAPQRYAALWHYLGYCLAQRIANQADNAEMRAAATKFMATPTPPLAGPRGCPNWPPPRRRRLPPRNRRPWICSINRPCRACSPTR